MKKLVKIILPALLFAALLVMNGRMSMKNMAGNITLSKLAISNICNAEFSEYWYPCGNILQCVYVPWEYGCFSAYDGSVCYCYCE
jgi:hypothetical protein